MSVNDTAQTPDLAEIESIRRLSMARAVARLFLHVQHFPKTHADAELAFIPMNSLLEWIDACNKLICGVANVYDSLDSSVASYTESHSQLTPDNEGLERRSNDGKKDICERKGVDKERIQRVRSSQYKSGQRGKSGTSKVSNRLDGRQISRIHSDVSRKNSSRVSGLSTHIQEQRYRKRSPEFNFHYEIAPRRSRSLQPCRTVDEYQDQSVNGAIDENSPKKRKRRMSLKQSRREVVDSPNFIRPVDNGFRAGRHGMIIDQKEEVSPMNCRKDMKRCDGWQSMLEDADVDCSSPSAPSPMSIQRVQAPTPCPYCKAMIGDLNLAKHVEMCRLRVASTRSIAPIYPSAPLTLSPKKLNYSTILESHWIVGISELDNRVLSLEVSIGSIKWTLKRNAAEFVELHTSLVSISAPKSATTMLSGLLYTPVVDKLQEILGTFSSRISLRKRLQHYIQDLVSIPFYKNTSTLQKFLLVDELFDLA